LIIYVRNGLPTCPTFHSVDPAGHPKGVAIERQRPFVTIVAGSSPTPAKHDKELGLRAVSLCYVDPFVRRRVEIRAPMAEFVREYGFDMPKL